ncbi:hypothetical protein M1437_03175 [Patescibacteria group bacterium]|nr:hypothetical protein [Patescibacteria group bacterium]
MNSIQDDFRALLRALIWYSKRKIIFLSREFENSKNFVKDFLMIGIPN